MYVEVLFCVQLKRTAYWNRINENGPWKYKKRRLYYVLRKYIKEQEIYKRTIFKVKVSLYRPGQALWFPGG
jgi:hypothetical protein